MILHATCPPTNSSLIKPSQPHLRIPILANSFLEVNVLMLMKRLQQALRQTAWQALRAYQNIITIMCCSEDLKWLPVTADQSSENASGFLLFSLKSLLYMRRKRFYSATGSHWACLEGDKAMTRACCLWQFLWNLTRDQVSRAGPIRSFSKWSPYYSYL